jgi:hypothetical protein
MGRAAVAFATAVILASAALVAASVSQRAVAGSMPALIAFDDDAAGIYEFTPGTTSPSLVVSAGVFPQFSPNGFQLAYDLARGNPESDPKATNSIEVADRNGKHPHAVLTGPITWDGTTTDDVHYPLAWSPNGTMLAYGCDGSQPGGGAQQAQICVVNVDTGAHHLITAKTNEYPLSESGQYERLNWTPDGKHLIADVRDPEPCQIAEPDGYICAQPQVAEISVASGSVELLTHYDKNGNGGSYAPELSANGKQIVYYHGDPSLTKSGLWVMDADGSHQHQVFNAYDTSIAPQAHSFTFSPDGKDILFTSYGPHSAGSTTQPYLIKSSGNGTPRLLYASNENVYDTVWAPVLTTCTVPNLKHKTLAQARTALTKAACTLGTVKGPKKHRAKRHVVSQHPKPNSDEPAGTKVNVTVR